jgi:hypothetical protein
MTVRVRLDDETEAKVRSLIARKGGTLSAFVRAAIAEKLERDGTAAPGKLEGEAKKPSPYELGKHLFGRYRSGLGDLSTNHKKYFKERMRAKHRR